MPVTAGPPPPPSDPEAAGAEGPGFSLHLGSSARERDYLRIGGGVVAGLALLGIVLFSFTDLSSAFLPMEDRYFQILLPETTEDTLPLLLTGVSDEMDGNRVSVDGTVANTSLETVEGLVAVLALEETTGRFPATVEVPIDPPILEPGESGRFTVTVAMQQRPRTYSISFRLADGPFVPHADGRGSAFEISIPTP
jgi:hypothetical protein